MHSLGQRTQWSHFYICWTSVTQTQLYSIQESACGFVGHLGKWSPCLVFGVASGVCFESELWRTHIPNVMLASPFERSLHWHTQIRSLWPSCLNNSLYFIYFAVYFLSNVELFFCIFHRKLQTPECLWEKSHHQNGSCEWIWSMIWLKFYVIFTHRVSSCTFSSSFSL